MKDSPSEWVSISSALMKIRCRQTDSFKLSNFSAGLLKVGVPKSWDDSKKDLRYIRRAGVRQFISTYNRVKDLKGNELLWGDEIEYGIFKLDADGKKVRICLRGKEVCSCCSVLCVALILFSHFG